ncbi:MULTISPECIES: hypothetical protein [Burkholderia cepacia complex]|uniref:hypothetical protein n=1 Tax=Burkholderia cepacia complex TaxID=87882 RepID=UPI00158AFCC5|nr:MULTISPECIES: hypothetical protein [Burkholderia cepacia complex]MBR8426368.1 hypothetical protein [Burkholderia cenocepacia]MBR8494768.1 hypothetical protein [Burkholderia cenocepacia]MCA8081408.1 hypothetical protein [Burkholderia cepacia]
MSDSFCSKTTMPNGKVIWGAPAREHRLKVLGGVDGLLKKVHEIYEGKNAEAAAEHAIGKAASSSEREHRSRTGEEVN